MPFSADFKPSKLLPPPILILVVDDNPITRKTVRLALCAEGYHVLEAEDGREALQQMTAEPPDLVLLDLLLPDIYGADLVTQLRALPGGADIPILAFSGFISKMEEARVAGAGFTDFLLKPIEPSHLVRIVASFLYRGAQLSVAPGAGRRLLLVDDDAVQLKLMRLQFQHVGFEVQVAHDGVQALTLALHATPDLIVSDALMPHLDGFELCMAVRQAPALQNVPLVIVSANYVEETDKELAEQVGASSLVTRERNFEVLLATALAAMAQPAPPLKIQPSELKNVRHVQIVRQLERQVKLHAACAQRNVVQSAILHELSQIAETLAKRKDLEGALDEILAFCMDGAGLSKGLLYLNDAEGRLQLSAQYGCAGELALAQRYFGAPDIFQMALRSGETVVLPSLEVNAAQTAHILAGAKAHSALLVPVHSGEKDIALLMLLSLHEDLIEEDWIAFGRALAAQIGQSVALSRAFFSLAESELRYRSLFEAANDGICITDGQGNIINANPAACALVGYSMESLRGKDLGEMLAGPDREHWSTMMREFQRSGELNGELTYLMRNGTEKTVEVHGATVKQDVYLNVLRDVTERRHAERTIQRLAYCDPLTELPNRIALQDRLRAALVSAKSRDEALAFFLLNLNGFREINDTLGHPVGDQLLLQVAERLKTILWESDMVARLAADEFGVLLPRLAERRDIEMVVKKVIEGLRTPFMMGTVPLDIQASIGIALYPDHGADADTLFQRADMALHEAKAQRQVYMIYDAAIDHYNPLQLGLMAELRAAIAGDELMLYYQPKMNLVGDALAGVEALIRWKHSARGFIPPMDFIPAAEKTSLIDDLTQWVIKNGLLQIDIWREAGLAIKVAVNISTRNLQDRDFVQQVGAALAGRNFEPGQLLFEITESAIMLDPQGAKRKLNEIYELGIRFSIDDFGTGYSSLAYLKELPVSQLKIDQSFIREFKDTRNAAIVRSTIDLAHNLGLTVTAEGVEDKETLDALLALGCDEAQGYYICRPVPVADFDDWFAKIRGDVALPVN